MAKNIEMNIKNNAGTYDVLYPKTTQELILNLLNNDTKQEMGLPENTTADEAFYYLYKQIYIAGKGYVNFLVTNELGQPVPYVKLNCENFITSKGNVQQSIFTDQQGRVSSFTNSENLSVSINMLDFQPKTEILNIQLSQETDYTIQLTYRSENTFTSSTSGYISGLTTKMDICCLVGGGGGGVCLELVVIVAILFN